MADHAMRLPMKQAFFMRRSRDTLMRTEMIKSKKQIIEAERVELLEMKMSRWDRYRGERDVKIDSYIEAFKHQKKIKYIISLMKIL